MSDVNIIDISGYVYSGKSSVSDILREVDGIFVPDVAEEFDLLRLPGGLIDLKNAVFDWSPTRTNAAYKNFKIVAERASRVLPWYKRFFSDGLAYSERYPGLPDALKDFLNDIVEARWKAPWPHENLTDIPPSIFFRKVLWRLGFMTQRDVFIIKKSDFLDKARLFTNTLLWSGVSRQRYRSLVVHNSLDAFDPERNHDLYFNAKSIVVDRDPRDIYAAAQFMCPGQPDYLNRYLKICGAHDVNIFIKRFLEYRKNVVISPNVLRLKYEDLIFNYEENLLHIFNFLKVDQHRHHHKMKFFSPQRSMINVGLWKSSKYRKWHNDFRLIEDACLIT